MVQLGQAWTRPVGSGALAMRRGALLAALVHHLEAEQDRWFLWLPVLFGAGMALYFFISSCR
jgi:hypothetical protein